MQKWTGEKGLGIIDTLIVLVLISILIGVVIPKYQRMADEARETALKMGLQNIRMAIRVYHMVNQGYPADLKDLVNKRFILPVREDTIFSQEYLRTLAMDADGYPLDPYGNRYRYDSISGHVASITEGYENW
jgi:type II secretory pathway pseudopilin PulG